MPFDGNSYYTLAISPGPTCTFSPCPDGNCTCRNIFGKVCGSLVGDILLYLSSPWGQYVPEALDAIGIGNIQTLAGDLKVDLQGFSTVTSSWTINMFPNLQVVRGRNRSTPAGNEVILGKVELSSFSPYFLLLPGPGLSKLRVVNYVVISGSQPNRCLNNDLAFLSSLECVGGVLSFRGTTLQSLYGLQRVSDGLPAVLPVQTGSGFTKAKFWITGTPSDVSALATYAGCGGNVRPDTESENVYIVVSCTPTTIGTITTWTALCAFIANSTCP